MTQCQICFRHNKKCTKERLFSDKVAEQMPKLKNFYNKDISKIEALVCEDCKKTLDDIKEGKQ